MPDRFVVSNTSPLLYLHQIGQLDLLRQLYGRVVVPEAVAKELARGAQLGIAVPVRRLCSLVASPLTGPIEPRSYPLRRLEAG
jgi:hypothetical protein